MNNRDRQQEGVTRDGVMEKTANAEKTLTQEERRAARQEKLKVFTEAAMMKREAERIQDERYRSIKTMDIDDWMKEFSPATTERASTLRSERMPEHEKKALSLVNEFKRLEQMVEKGGRTSHMAQDHLEKLADKMSHQKDVMQYVRENHASMEKQIDKQTREFQRDRGLELEL